MGSFSKKLKEEILNKSKWLPDHCNFYLRTYCYRNNITSINQLPKCPVCETPITYMTRESKFKAFCSDECKKSDKGKEHTKAKRIKYMQDNYGVSYVTQRKDVKDKIKQSNLDKYGCSHPMQSEEIKKKLKATNNNRYGCDNPLDNKEIREKVKQTKLKKYGVEHHMHCEDIKSKIAKTNLKKYGSSSPFGNKKIKEKIKQNNLDKYGYEYPIQRDDIKEKTKRTNLKKYGSSNPFGNEEIKEKIKQTNLDRYGHKNPIKNEEIKEKTKQTNLKRYGVFNPFENEEIKEKIKQTNLDRYGCKSPIQNKEIKEKIKETNLNRYKCKYPQQNKDIQEKTQQTNLEKYGCKSPSQNEEIKNRVQVKRKSNYVYTFVTQLKLKYMKLISSMDNYIDGNDSKILCLRCNSEFITDQSNPQKIYCPNPIHTKYIPELELIDFIKSLNITNIQSQKNFNSGTKNAKQMQADLFLPDYDVGIEHHGLYWHSNLHKEPIYHQAKYKFFKEKNIKLIQIFSNEWINKRPIVESIIRNILSLNTDRIYARQCEVKELSTKEYEEFLEANHIQGYALAKIKLGLFYNNELVSVQSYSVKRFETSIDLSHFEMIRFCNKINLNVVGGFSKLLKYFKRKYSPKKITSFIDVRYFDGSGYIENGFKIDLLTYPNYFYFKKGENSLHNRMKFQKSKLENKLELFDPSLSEKDNMIMNSYLYIHDAGNLRISMVLSENN